VPERTKLAFRFKNLMKASGVIVAVLMLMGILGGVLELIFPSPGTFVGRAHGQTVNRTYQDNMGRQTGRSTTDAQGRSTYQDNMGRNTGRSETHGNTTTFYDNMGRETGRSTTK
jgi:hypothetical protein